VTEQHGDLPVVLRDLAGQLFVGGQDLAQAHEGAHNRDVDIGRAIATQDEESMATPCSVNTQGGFRRPPRPAFDIAICDIKELNSSWVS
jgi:hypothetical protein